MNIEHRGGKVIIPFDGEINARTGMEYKEEVLKLFGESDIFVISFNDVVYLNSSGLREIIDMLKKAGKAKKELRLTQMSKDIRDMFAFTGLDKVFKITDTLEEALA